MSVILTWTKAVRELTGSKQCYKDLFRDRKRLSLTKYCKPVHI